MRTQRAPTTVITMEFLLSKTSLIKHGFELIHVYDGQAHLLVLQEQK